VLDYGFSRFPFREKVAVSKGCLAKYDVVSFYQVDSSSSIKLIDFLLYQKIT
jgi:hypothetical protein